jgi:DNA repair protein RecO (recombination protein O)
VELLDKTLRQPEVHPELFWFISGALQWMDREAQTANLPLYVTLRVGELLGFRLYGSCSDASPYLDLREGCFSCSRPGHPHFLEEDCSRITDRLLKLEGFDDLKEMKMDKHIRHRLLAAYQDYYQLHLPGFTGLKSPKILAEVLQ